MKCPPNTNRVFAKPFDMTSRPSAVFSAWLIFQVPTNSFSSAIFPVGSCASCFSVLTVFDSSAAGPGAAPHPVEARNTTIEATRGVMFITHLPFGRNQRRS
jgi:hypothetical protein